MRRMLYITIGWTLMLVSGHAQDEYVKVKSNQEFIKIKWFPNELVYEPGFNIYRAEEGSDDFIKINDEPVKVEIEQRDALDRESNRLAQITEQYLQDPETPMAKFYILVKAMDDDQFAKWLGIRYDDATADSAKNYRYRIDRVNGKTVGVSETIALRDIYDFEPPKEGQLVFRSPSKITLKWLPETNRYFGVNVYRKSVTTDWVQLNTVPVIPAEVPDEFGILRYPDFFFEDTSITDISYQYVLTALDPFGDESSRSEIIEVRSRDFKPPSEVENIYLQGQMGAIDIRWEASTSKDIAGYNILRLYRDTVYEIINDRLITDLSYTDLINDPGAYFYVIEAVDEAGNVSRSEVKHIIISDLTPPPAPTNLSIQIIPGRVDLSWEGEITSDFWGFRILRSNKENPLKKDFLPAIPEPILEKDWTEKVAGEAEMAIYYAIVAIDTFNNESEWLISERILTPDTVAPKPALITGAQVFNDKVEISWQKSPSSDLEGYQLYRCIKSKENWDVINDNLIASDIEFFVDDQPINNELLCYKIVAIDDAGNISPESNVFTIRTKAVEINADALIFNDIGYRRRDKAVELTWKVMNASDFQGYMVYRASNGEDFLPSSPFLQNLNYRDENIEEKETYRYRIHAFGKTGQVLVSDIKNIDIK